jgi:hypothetical protein
MSRPPVLREVHPTQFGRALSHMGSGVAAIDALPAQVLRASVQRDLNAEESRIAIAFHHESMHFLQALTTSYMYAFALDCTFAVLNLLNHFDDFLASPSAFLDFLVLNERLSDRSDGISAEDLCEGGAVIGAFRLARPAGSLADFLLYLDEFFPGGSESTYRRAFDTLAYATSPRFAFDYLGHLSYLALQDSNPGACFDRIICGAYQFAQRKHPYEVSIWTLFDALKVPKTAVYLTRLSTFPPSHRHPIYYSYASKLVADLGASTLAEIGARPILLRAKGLLKEEHTTMFCPPVVNVAVDTETGGSSLKYGLARTDAGLCLTAIQLHFFHGAVERILSQDADEIPAMACAHVECPHYASRLCFRKYPPIADSDRWTECRFPKDFQAVTGKSPAEAWSAVEAIRPTLRAVRSARGAEKRGAAKAPRVSHAERLDALRGDLGEEEFYQEVSMMMPCSCGVMFTCDEIVVPNQTFAIPIRCPECGAEKVVRYPEDFHIQM